MPTQQDCSDAKTLWKQIACFILVLCNNFNTAKKERGEKNAPKHTIFLFGAEKPLAFMSLLKHNWHHNFYWTV